MLFWRSLSHWLGGMGIILLSLAIFPILPTGITLFQAEVPGLAPERILPRLKQTAVAMWLIYAALSLLQMVALSLAGLSFFESLIHTLGTVSTGGFSSRDLSVQAFANGTVEWVVTIFMFLSGVNFTLYYRLFRRKSLQRSFAATEFKMVWPNYSLRCSAHRLLPHGRYGLFPGRRCPAWSFPGGFRLYHHRIRQRQF